MNDKSIELGNIDIDRLPVPKPPEIKPLTPEQLSRQKANKTAGIFQTLAELAKDEPIKVDPNLTAEQGLTWLLNIVNKRAEVEKKAGKKGPAVAVSDAFAKDSSLPKILFGTLGVENPEEKKLSQIKGGLVGDSLRFTQLENIIKIEKLLGQGSK